MRYISDLWYLLGDYKNTETWRVRSKEAIAKLRAAAEKTRTKYREQHVQQVFTLRKVRENYKLVVNYGPEYLPGKVCSQSSPQKQSTARAREFGLHESYNSPENQYGLLTFARNRRKDSG